MANIRNENKHGKEGSMSLLRLDGLGHNDPLPEEFFTRLQVFLERR